MDNLLFKMIKTKQFLNNLNQTGQREKERLSRIEAKGGGERQRKEFN